MASALSPRAARLFTYGNAVTAQTVITSATPTPSERMSAAEGRQRQPTQITSPNGMSSVMSMTPKYIDAIHCAATAPPNATPRRTVGRTSN